MGKSAISLRWTKINPKALAVLVKYPEKLASDDYLQQLNDAPASTHEILSNFLVYYVVPLADFATYVSTASNFFQKHKDFESMIVSIG